MRSYFHLPAMITCAMLAITGVSTQAMAQIDSREGIALQNQIYQLRQEIQNLRDQGVRGGGSAPAPRSSAPAPVSNDMMAQLLTRVDALEEQVRQLRGAIEETQYRQDRQGADLNKRIDDLAFQMGVKAPPAPGAAPPSGDLSQSGGPPGATALVPPPLVGPGLAPAPAPSAPAQPPAPRVRTPELALQEGNAALARRDYAAAEAAAREVLANRTSPRAYDAQLLLADALSGQRQYPQAAIAYDDAYNRSRKGAHAQDALLGLAGALTAINEKKAACDTLRRLNAEFPQPRTDLRPTIAATTQRAGCK